MAISASYPFNLQNGTTADATQVMADFLQIQNDINANAAQNGVNSDITQLTGLTTPLSVAQGGTGGATAAAARASLGAAQLGANSDITSLSGLSTPLSIAQGGTGSITAAAALLALGAAPLASPVFTGDPQAPTPAASDNDTSIANTAWTNAAITLAIATALGGVPFTSSFTSSELTLATGSVQTVAHGLGGVPKLVTMELVCKTADLDYSVNDRVVVTSWIFPSSQNYGSTLTYNATNISATIGNSGYYISYKSGTNRSLITDSSWRIVVKAYK